MTRSPLFDDYPPHVIDGFKKFHLANPEVFREFKRLAFQMKTTGRESYGAQSIVEVLRWHRNIETTGDEFKINNNFVALYARLMIHYHPEFRGFFELRKVVCRWPA